MESLSEQVLMKSMSRICPPSREYMAPAPNFPKSDSYSVWQGHRKFDLFAERNENNHSAQRRLVSRIYSMEALKDLEKYVDNAVALFISIMQKRQNQDINMGLHVQLFAFGGLTNFPHSLNHSTS